MLLRNYFCRESSWLLQEFKPCIAIFSFWRFPLSPEMFYWHDAVLAILWDGFVLPHGMIHQAVRMTSLFIIHLKQPKPSCLVPKPLLTVNTVWGSICDLTKTFRRVWVEQNFEPCTEHMRKLKCVSSNSRGCMNWTGI